MVNRPTSLEELIPEEVRVRWGITTSTPITWPRPLTLETRECEVAESNSIVIEYSSTGGRLSGMDAQIRKFMKANGLVNSGGHTKHAMTDNIRKLREWAVSQGRKVVFRDSDSAAAAAAEAKAL